MCFQLCTESGKIHIKPSVDTVGTPYLTRMSIKLIKFHCNYIIYKLFVRTVITILMFRDMIMSLCADPEWICPCSMELYMNENK